MTLSTRPTLVCALDFSAGSEAALVRAADLAERLHARLHLLHAASLSSAGRRPIPHPDAPHDRHAQRIRAFAAEALGGREAVEEIGPEVVVRHGEYAGDAILRYAEDSGAGLVVLGTHGRRGFQRLVLGSVAEAVTRRALCPVLTVPHAAARTAPAPDAPVLVPVDFSEHSRRALRLATRLAELYRAPLALVHVVHDAEPVPVFYPGGIAMTAPDVPVLMERAAEELHRFAAETRADLQVQAHVRTGQPHREILALSEEIGAGLVVMATHGLTGVQHALVGSVTERTLRQAPCPVLAVRATAAEPATASPPRAESVSYGTG